LGVWASLDPVEDDNRYAYVGGNPVTRIDPSGMIFENPYQYDSCKPQQTSGHCDQFCGVDIDRFLDCRKQTGGRICPTGWVQTGQANDPVCQLGLAYSPPSEAFLLSREWEDCSGVEWGADVRYIAVFAMPFSGASVNIVQALARWALLGFTVGAAASVLAPPMHQPYRAITEADLQGIKDWSRSRDVPVPIPRGKLPDDENCNSFVARINGIINELMDDLFFYDIGLLENCNSLPRRYRYRTAGEAFSAEFSSARRLAGGATAVRGPCKYLGLHHNVQGGVNQGSVVCCPCCDETTNTITDRCGAV
jgi:hypothetical protein